MATATQEPPLARTQTADVVKTAARRDIKQLLEGPQLKAAIQAALPRHLTAERFIRTAITATMRTPAILQCTQESFFQCLLDLSAFGLEPDGRRAHLIPYGNKCTLVLDYKGLVELVRRSGDVSYIHADVVYEGDEFNYGYGSKAHLDHVPNLDRKEEARPVAYYSFVRLKDGSEDFMVMSKARIDAIRKRSKSGNNGPWVTDYDEMGKKSVFRNHSKWLPLSYEVRNAIEYGDDAVDIQASNSAADSIHASISLDQITASSDPNRGHDATVPQTEQPKESASAPAQAGAVNGSESIPGPQETKPPVSPKRFPPKNGIAVMSALPATNQVVNGQKIYLRTAEGDTLYAFDEELGQFLIVS